MPTNPAFAYGISRIAAPFLAGETTTQPTTETKQQDWFDRIGQAAKKLGTQAAAEIEQAAGGGQGAQPGAQQPMPGSQVPITAGPEQSGAVGRHQAVPYPSPAAPRGGGASGGQQIPLGPQPMGRMPQPKPEPPAMAPFSPQPGPAKPAFAAGAPMPSPQRPGPPQMAGVETGPAVDLDPDTAARGLIKRSPTMQRATADPAAAMEEMTGQDVDSLYREMKETSDAPLPDEQELTRQEKGQLMLEMGLRIMSSGPGLVQALGNAGLHTMGTYAGMQQQKREAEMARREQQMDVLGTGVEIGLEREGQGLEREKMGSREAIARDRMASREDIAAGDRASRETIAAQKARIAEQKARLEAQRPLSSAAKLRADRDAGRITQEEYDRARERESDLTSLQKDAPYIARALNISEAEAVNTLLMSKAARDNPEAFEREVYTRLIGKLGTNHEKALDQARKARAAFEQDPETLEVEPAAPETQEDGGGGFSIRGLTEDAIAAAREAFGGGPAATADVPQETTTPQAQALPPDPAQLEEGAVYEHNGQRLRWTGQDFEIVG